MGGASLHTFAPTPSAGAVIGHELVINGNYSSSAGHTLTNMVIALGQCSGVGDATQTDQVTSLETLVPGTYRVLLNIDATDGSAPVSAIVGGASAALAGSDSPGFNTNADIVVSSVANQLIILSADGIVITVSNWRCSRIA